MVPKNESGAVTMKNFLLILGISTFCVSVALGSAAVEASSTGYASYYKTGKRTASGENYNPHGLTAAHRNLPFGTRLKVTNLGNGKSVVVRVNDRGPFIKRRLIDLSYGAAKAIDLTRSGIAKVSFIVID
jgi:rare lipoprotein A